MIAMQWDHSQLPIPQVISTRRQLKSCLETLTMQATDEGITWCNMHTLWLATSLRNMLRMAAISLNLQAI